MSRPEPTHRAPAGTHWQAFTDGPDWIRIDGELSCRMRLPGKPVRYCRAHGRIAYNRRAWDPRAKNWFPRWWAYCEQHAYGRWIERSQVWHWRLVEDGPPRVDASAKPTALDVDCGDFH